jgi:DNA-binding winged helix-turn-helix (wHTH) protein/tetratricopeptide (TPR) repeat protein
MNKPPPFREESVGRRGHWWDGNVLRDSAGQVVALREQTRQVLALLIEARGALVEKTEFFDRLWGESPVTDDSLVQCIKEIRSAIEDRDRRVLQSEYRRGYRLHGSSFNRQVQASPGAPTRTIAVLAWHRTSPPAAVIEPLVRRLPATLAFSLSACKRPATLPFLHSEALPPQLSLHQIAQTLHADYLVDGHITDAGAYLLCTVNLIEAASGRTFFSERFQCPHQLRDHELAQWCQRAAQSIIAAVNENIWQRHRAQYGSTDLATTDLRSILERLSSLQHECTAATFHQAHGLADHVLRQWPNSSRALTRVAALRLQDIELTITGHWDDQRAEEILELTRRAVALDPLDATALGLLARACCAAGAFELAKRFGAEALARGSLELHVHHYVSSVQFYIGEWNAAKELALKTLDGGPFRYHYYLASLGRALFALDERRGAIDVLEEAVIVQPLSHFARMTLIVAYREAGMKAAAQRHSHLLHQHCPHLRAEYFGLRWSAIPELRDRYLAALQLGHRG